MKIVKYELEITDQQYFDTGNSQGLPLSVAEQNGKLVLWAKVTDDVFPKGHKSGIEVNIIGTGNPIDASLSAQDFLDTVVMSNGLVWHVFAKTDDNGAQWCYACGTYYTDPPVFSEKYFTAVCPACNVQLATHDTDVKG